VGAEAPVRRADRDTHLVGSGRTVHGLRFAGEPVDVRPCEPGVVEGAAHGVDDEAEDGPFVRPDGVELPDSNDRNGDGIPLRPI
jgi:hypothetical protein